jgi:hypothetical protein
MTRTRTTPVRTLVGAVVGAAALTFLSVAPASASNPVLTHSWATGKYLDETDQLCARVDSAFGTSATWATAEIRLDGVLKWSKSDYGNGDTAFSCTGNLSIPEDKQYVLVVRACTTYANPTCTSDRTTFYS